MSDSLTTIYVEPDQCPSHHAILLTQGRICEIFTKKFWELAILKNGHFWKTAILDFFSKKNFFFFALFSWKSVQIYMVEWMGWKEKESWSSVGGFGMETSNFALNRCLRVSIDRFFDARSNHGLRISLRTLWALWFTKNVFFDDFYTKFRQYFTLLSSFSSKKRIFRPVCINSETVIRTGLKLSLI